MSAKRRQRIEISFRLYGRCMRPRASRPRPHKQIRNRLAALVRFQLRGLPGVCSCVTNQRCASGCAIASSAPKRIRKAAKASLHRPRCNPPITMPVRPPRLRRRANQRNRRMPNRRLKRGRRLILSLIGARLRKRVSSHREPRVQMGTAFHAVDVGGEEVDEAGAGRRLRELWRPPARWEMARRSPLRRSKHRALRR